MLPAKGTASEFLKHRIGKIVGPTVFWSLFYMVANIVQNGSADWPSTVKSLLSVPFSAQGYGVLWFMYTLAGLYIIAPVLSHWLEQASRKEIEFYLALWVVTMCYPLISLVLDVNRDVDGILYYCTGYVGYFLLGYYLHRYGSPVGYRLLIPGCLVGVAALAGSHLVGLELDFYDMFWYLSVFMLVFCMAWFKFLTSAFRGGRREDSAMVQIRHGAVQQSFIRRISDAYFHYAIPVVGYELDTADRMLSSADTGDFPLVHFDYCGIVLDSQQSPVFRVYHRLP